MRLKASFLGEEVGEAVLPEDAEPFPLSVNQEKGMKGEVEERLEPSTGSLQENSREQEEKLRNIRRNLLN